MGSASSKAAKTATGAASRQYPTRVPHNHPTPYPSSNPPAKSSSPGTTYTSPIISTPAQATQATSQQSPTINDHDVSSNKAPQKSPPSSAGVSTSRNAAIDHDASDPDFAASLRQLGPVTPSSTRSNSSTFSSTSTVSHSASTTTTTNSTSQTKSPPQYHSSSSGNNATTTTIFPTQSQRQSPTNPAILILQARNRLAAEAEREFAAARTTSSNTNGNGNSGSQRRFLDVTTIREALVLRDAQGLDGREIEERLGLKSGVMGMLAGVGEARVGKRDRGDSGIY